MIHNWKKFLESVGKIPIEDHNSYIDAMALGIIDKMFFVSKIKPDVIVDFGCADGQLLEAVYNIMPEVKLIGYDISKDMITKAQNRLGDLAIITDDWNRVVEELGGYKRPTLVLSSVIHEVYSYASTKYVSHFWTNVVFGSHFKYISIRDMIPSTQMESYKIEDFKDDVEKVKEISIPKYLNSYESKWGSIGSNYRTFIHYLLKYRYIDNWERENNENYVPISIETLIKKIPSDFKIKYQMSYVYKHLSEEVYKDFGITINHSTHLKMIIENKKFGE
jgi:hypothetical protein